MSKELKSLYKIGNGDKSHLLYIANAEDSYSYEVYSMETKKRVYRGLLSLGDVDAEWDYQLHNPLTIARDLATKQTLLDYGPIAKVGLTMLNYYKESPIYSMAIWEQESLPHNDIRFIDSQYHELFRIPDDGTIMIDYPDRHFAAKCQYLDDYHTSINGVVFHICQFAEMLERNRGACRPEPQKFSEEAAWKIGTNSYLTVETVDGGWAYRFFDSELEEKKHGKINDPSIYALEAREKALSILKIPYHSRTSISYFSIMEEILENSGE